MTNSYAVIILAAGSSGRLGRPKQLLPFKNKPLLQYLIDEAKNTLADTVIVVLGANAEIIKNELQTDNIHIAINENWKEGMSSSIRCGINELQTTNPAVDAALLMVCDQPFVTTALLNELIVSHRNTKKHIVTCSYDETTGPPALFDKILFPELLQLEGDAGARKIVQQNTDEVVSVPFSKGVIDIDTATDYQNLIR